ncbi:molybdopterin-dependent oxidoreductase [Caballeronia sp. LP006]|jgi:DMSO/TMAO reductase YedYZ molybdopterin-dependent catalytic subunit|uniref:molybdopterin-dependent oxidoreductase n=1 Tax=unclassified Caballeronia TaxID=2646786 RepID=UPI002029598F|nr:MULTISPECIES: molybdopterin-dependent oxidoreductase [unclassified Caballeronia]MDR5774884.1 molybdopterin-dependent oxidoreductase [Caballeronia sp. LZ002]MDR5799513.1 molybdopterin-dependent oxidoreductase [Caballeronia sp. LZ001]MDR5827269.1 molybdopterin-dependent oxidoreductase [Caballeronia sp. LP006]MDR5850320.1 molybdopterin-dependent oxidoreductase [Caballeronia sp. LZ003]
MNHAHSLSLSPVVQIGGAVERPLVLDVAALREFASASIDPFDLVCFSTGRYIRPVERYQGVQLRVLLDAAGVRRPGSTDFKRTVFLAHAHDGYAVTFSWHELFNTPVGEQVIVAYACADRELGVEDGLPVLVSGADTVHAPRHLKRLVRVDAHVLGSGHSP